MEKLFNIIAETVSIIVKQKKEALYVKGSYISPSKKRDYDNLLMEYVPQIRDNEGTPKAINQTIADEIYQGLGDLIELFTEKEDYSGMLYTLNILDLCFKPALDDIAKDFQYESSSEMINSNVLECGTGLLPKVVCGWERKNTGQHHYNKIDNFMRSFLIVDYEQLGDMCAEHHFLSPELFWHDTDNEHRTLKIAVCPLKMKKDFTVEVVEKENITRFDIKYTGNMSEDNQIIWNKILEASENEVDIIVFPEMMGNVETELYIKDRIKTLGFDEKEKLPAIIVQPSVWNENSNFAAVVNRYGKCLFKQYKQYPFGITQNQVTALENIEPDHKIHIIHCEGLGRIAIMICKDFLTLDYLRKAIEVFHLTLILVPSFTTGSYDFMTTQKACMNNDCNVVWINTCAAYVAGKEKNFKYIGCYYKSGKRFSGERKGEHTKEICEHAFSQNCTGDCMYYDKICY